MKKRQGEKKQRGNPTGKSCDRAESYELAKVATGKKTCRQKDVAWPMVTADKTNSSAKVTAM